MKLSILLIVLAANFAIPSYAQKGSKKDDVYPVSLESRIIPKKKAYQDTLFGFKIKETALVWQKVYNSNESFENIANYFKRSGLFKEVGLETNQLTGFLTLFEVTEIGTGLETKPRFSGFAIIEVKDGRYRVTIKKMLIQRYSDELSLISGYDNVALKKNKEEFRPSFLRKDGEALNNQLNSMFKLNDTDNDNW